MANPTASLHALLAQTIADAARAAGRRTPVEARITMPEPGHRLPEAIYVLPARATASSNSLANGVSQQVAEAAGVHIATRPPNRAAEAEMDALRAFVRGAVLGKTYPEFDGAMVTYAGGQLIEVDRDRFLLWADHYVIQALWRTV